MVPRKNPCSVSPHKRLVLLGAGHFFLVLGLIGVFVPLLPTTPFLLLTSFCYARSSERWNQWLLNSRWLGPYLRDFQSGMGIPLRAKILTIVLLWASLSYGIFVAIPEGRWIPKVLMGMVGVGVTAHLLCLKTRRFPSVPLQNEKDAR